MASLRLAAEAGRRTVIRQSGLPRNPAVTQFRFSVWTRTRDLAPGWILRVGVERWQAGRYVATMQNLHVLCTGTVDWTRTDIPFTPHDGTAEFAVYIGLWYPESLANSPPAGGGSVWIDDVTLEPVPAESATPTAAAASPAAARLEVQSFHPLGEAGLFTPGQPLELELVLLNRGTAPLATQVTVSLADVAGAPAGRCTLDATLPPGVSTRQPVRFDATKGRGFVCARAEVREAGDLLAWSSTGRGGVRGHGSRACGHLRSRRGPAATGRLRLHIPSRWRRRGGALDHRRGALYGPGHTAGAGPGLRSHGQ
jgi:hypothetical protein